MNGHRVIAISSGKGGTGKTTIATNLALVTPSPVRLLDCDVEEPNAHIFLKPDFQQSETVSVLVPRIDDAKCTGCGECSRICQFNALAVVRDKVLVFDELCHSCGGCRKVCPEGAITESTRPIGVLERGQARHIEFVHGRLNVGEAQSPPLISAVRKSGENGGLTLIDAPPGTSCPVIESVRGSDFVVLVTEPTPFGLNDLALAVNMVAALGIPSGVVINRSDIGDDRVHRYCREQGIPVLLEIPDDRRVAEAYSRGDLPAEVIPEYAERIRDLQSTLEELIS